MDSLGTCREDCAHCGSSPWLDQERGKKNGGEKGFLHRTSSGNGLKRNIMEVRDIYRG